MAITIKTTNKVDDAAGFVALSISNKLKLNMKVLFFVSGGSSIDVAIKVADYIRDYPHENLTVMLADERYGQVGHADSNWQKLMGKGFNLPQAKLIPVLSGDDKDKTAENYNKAVEDELRISTFKIGLFGIGIDGHTAGILPETIAVQSTDSVCGYGTSTFSRITITKKTIEKLDEAVIWAHGDTKWPAIKDLENNIDFEKQPAQILKKVPLLTIFTDYKIVEYESR